MIQLRRNILKFSAVQEGKGKILGMARVENADKEDPEILKKLRSSLSEGSVLNLRSDFPDDAGILTVINRMVSEGRLNPETISPIIHHDREIPFIKFTVEFS